MAESDIEKKVNALRDQPTLVGKVVTESTDSVVLRVGGNLVEVPTQYIAARADPGGTAGEVELTISPDAEVLVSSVVPVSGGLVSGNIFAGLRPGLMADAGNCNCNCNCNCDGVSSRCNCNCNSQVSVAAESLLSHPVGTFRTPISLLS
jgi:hypothetical protein